MKKKMGLVHFLAQCQECAWNTQDYINGPKNARSHAQAKNHVIDVEEGYNGIYDGKQISGVGRGKRKYEVQRPSLILQLSKSVDSRRVPAVQKTLRKVPLPRR